MEEMVMYCLDIIANVGDARSSFIQAIAEAKQGNYAEANRMIAAGEESFAKGHAVHAELIQKTARGEDIPFSLIIVHAEDQLMSAESFKILAKEFIDVYRKIEET